MIESQRFASIVCQKYSFIAGFQTKGDINIKQMFRR